MTYIKRLCLLALGAVWAFSATLAAQEECPAYVTEALQTVGDACAELGRNQACYGFPDISAQLADPEWRFETAGDMVPLSVLQSIAVIPPTVAANTYGIALLKVQANLPDTLPGQNVTLLLFGDVMVERDTRAEAPTADLQAQQAVNVRRRPSVESAVLASLAVGQTITANGISADGAWARVMMPDGRTGWVAAAFLSGDTSALITVEGGESAYRPMQAFYFRSGVGQAACADLPDSGVLIQTPEGAGTIQLRINEVDFQIGSTIYLQASPTGGLVVHVLEGRVTVTSAGESVSAESGFSITVPLDEDLRPAGPPSPAEPSPAGLAAVWSGPLAQNLLILAPPPSVAAPPANPAGPSANPIAPPPSATDSGTTTTPPNASGGCSIHSDQPSQMTFTNASSRTVNVIWISFDCAEVLYQTLGPGQSYLQNTYLTHPWIVRDASSGALVGGPYLPPGNITIGD